MQQPATAPQGIPAILQALAVGGQPNGNIAQLPTPMNPAAIATPGANPMMPSPVQPSAPGLPQSGAVDPLTGALASTNPEQLQMILQALMQTGAFNATAMPG